MKRATVVNDGGRTIFGREIWRKALEVGALVGRWADNPEVVIFEFRIT